MDRYGPKHVELTPKYYKNLISATTLCISLDCMYIAKMIHGPSNVKLTLDYSLRTIFLQTLQLGKHAFLCGAAAQLGPRPRRC